ncbi:hypothetical protein [Paludisphaera soli]|uniref:hypothetical protein n=1 Tax=Paludisphaera soli TaxID=2712865 RepID=UPI0013EC6335|nr:hypothetical protein [Paludisphaera soli]
MPRRQKPPGYEKWTWDEINQGRKMSKSEKRYRRLGVGLGASKDARGNVTPPSYHEAPQFYWVMGGLLVMALIALIVQIAKQVNR